MEHVMPSYIPYFDETQQGLKRHEIRQIMPGQPFQVGDILTLREYDRENAQYTGRKQQVRVTWMSPAGNGQDGKAPGYAYMSIKRVKKSWWQGLFGSTLFGGE